MTSSTTGNGLIQSLGVGSGLDIQSLVTQLVAAERAPVENRLMRQASDVATQLSALGSLKGALAGFQAALASLKTVDQFAARTATSGDTDVYAASAGSSAVPGSYAVEVRQLAQPEQLISQPFADGAAAVVGTGTLTLKLGASQSFAVTLDASHDTLADVRDAINGAADNPGINATLVYGINGAQLVLTSAATGADQTIELSASGGDGGLAQLTYSPGAPGNYTEKQAAQDAIVLISGVEHHSASNVVDAAIDGVTLTLKSANPGATVDLTVSSDRSTVLANIRKFVSAYNGMQSQLAALGRYDAATKKGGPLLGDWLLTGISLDMARGATDRVASAGGSCDSLAAVGVTTDSSGQLQLDETRLTAALQADPGAVASLFGASDGVAARLYVKIDAALAGSGAIAARNDNLADAQKRIDADSEKLNQQMDVVQQRYLAQFTALDALLAQLNSTSKYLTQQLANAASIGKSSSSN